MSSHRMPSFNSRRFTACGSACLPNLYEPRYGGGRSGGTTGHSDRPHTTTPPRDDGAE
jgi:hypothetical protein